MTEQNKNGETLPEETPSEQSPLAEYAELEQNIRRRLRSNQRFLERFMDEDFNDDEEMPEEDDSAEEEL